ncbi:unnamed protein product [Protopolystoma xenopodis]|uniref:Uncharacterized protein n=1 Tax=Protopolystoma xenopodis TaxID=117903 RepID=A0A3S5CQN2_9PLAT|nr:unnamed protein product [Protopolystoma xenopodis]
MAGLRIDRKGVQVRGVRLPVGLTYQVASSVPHGLTAVSGTSRPALTVPVAAYLWPVAGRPEYESAWQQRSQNRSSPKCCIEQGA